MLGPDHPDTLNSRNNLAYAYQAAGDLDRAISLWVQPVPGGVDHPTRRPPAAPPVRPRPTPPWPRSSTPRSAARCAVPWTPTASPAPAW
ncbi:tetratricopeptide repeat protein [Nonomuraea polychroma]|uniref:tetratricopeptide repeat protein n=1 Tax=Nonomuraea polychroma TaxID=46176 RepID=UPI0019D4C612